MVQPMTGVGTNGLSAVLLHPEAVVLVCGGLAGATIASAFWGQCPTRGRSLLPKMAAFVLVLVTHWLFLRDLVMRFLPGQKQLCSVGALLQVASLKDLGKLKNLVNSLRDAAT
jgi:type II secretory pathway component PulM